MSPLTQPTHMMIQLPPRKPPAQLKLVTPQLIQPRPRPPHRPLMPSQMHPPSQRSSQAKIASDLARPTPATGSRLRRRPQVRRLAQQGHPPRPGQRQEAGCPELASGSATATCLQKWEATTMHGQLTQTTTCAILGEARVRNRSISSLECSNVDRVIAQSELHG